MPAKLVPVVDMLFEGDDFGGGDGLLLLEAGEEGVGGWAAGAAFGGEEFDEDRGNVGCGFWLGGLLGGGISAGVDGGYVVGEKEGDEEDRGQDGRDDESCGAGWGEVRHRYGLDGGRCADEAVICVKELRG